MTDTKTIREEFNQLNRRCNGMTFGMDESRVVERLQEMCGVLLAEVERLQLELDSSRRQGTQACDDLVAERELFKSEIERLQSALDAAQRDHAAMRDTKAGTGRRRLWRRFLERRD